MINDYDMINETYEKYKNFIITNKEIIHIHIHGWTVSEELFSCKTSVLQEILNPCCYGLKKLKQ